MLSIYLYALDTMADWEIGHIMAELGSKRFFKDGAPELSVKVCALSKEPVKTMGGLTITPDCALDEIAMDDKSVLLLPGATAWSEQKHAAAVQKASELLSCGGTVAAICGATLALAHAGLLDKRPHTSNGSPGPRRPFGQTAPYKQRNGLFGNVLSDLQGKGFLR